MSSDIKILPHYTYEEYRLWEGRWELIEGIPDDNCSAVVILANIGE